MDAMLDIASDYAEAIEEPYICISVVNPTDKGIIQSYRIITVWHWNEFKHKISMLESEIEAVLREAGVH